MPVPDFNSPASNAVAVTKSDATILPAFRALYVGGAGDVAVTTVDGANATFSGAPAGLVIPIRGTKVLSTGTTATLILALY